MYCVYAVSKQNYILTAHKSSTNCSMFTNAIRAMGGRLGNGQWSYYKHFSCKWPIINYNNHRSQDCESMIAANEHYHD